MDKNNLKTFVLFKWADYDRKQSYSFIKSIFMARLAVTIVGLAHT
jgi:hypothetical protein